MCLRVENVHLPPNAFFGMSAATGALADDHDVLSLLTHSIHDQLTRSATQMSDAERQKLDTQYQEYYQQLEQSKQEYQKLNPNLRAPAGLLPPDMQFEQPQDRELRQIFEGQSMIHQVWRNINKPQFQIIKRVFSN